MSLRFQYKKGDELQRNNHVYRWNMMGAQRAVVSKKAKK